MYKNNQRHMLRILMLGIICVASITTKPTFAQQKEYEVLILNSYHSNYSWTQQQVHSIIDQLKPLGTEGHLHVEHMDWKRFPNQTHLNKLYQIYEYKYKDTKIDVIITTDNAALEFALKHRKELFFDAPIVFSGVNAEDQQQIIGNETNLTGVTEPVELGETITMALQINPNLRELYIVHDQTRSSKTAYHMTVKLINSLYPEITPIGISNITHEKVVQKVKGLGEDSAVLIMSYHTDILGKVVDSEEFCKDVSDVSQVPVFHIQDFTVGYGNIGGSMISGSIQGERAGELAIRILEGENPDQIPINNDYEMRVVFDYVQLQRFNIPIKRVPQGAEIINEPFSFFKTYRNLVITVLLILGLLIIFIIVLILYLKEIARIKNDLQESNEEITQTYEELTASDEELQQQVEELSAIQLRLRKMSYEDELTGLPNKRALHEDFNACVSQCTDQKGAVIFVDADNFKLINDTLGHSLGDEFIIAIGQRLKSLVGPSIQLYRMGGDEFILLIHGMEDVNTIEKTAADIMKGFQKAIEIKEMLIHTSLSAGIAVFPDHGTTAEELIMRADIAMYKAKEEGKAKYIVYESQMNQDLVENVEIQKNLRNAISKEELILYYQPQYDFKTRQIIGFEALIRWDSEELGWVMPYKFIRVAEENHTIIPIGRWALDRACQFIKKVHNLGYADYTMAVNISLLQIMQDDFVEMVLAVIRKYDLDPGHLEVEMTETMLIQNFDLVTSKLELLREQGIKVALDDFGTGYSSLNYLNVLPISTLKIDKSFVDIISTHPGHKVIINNIISLGQGMGLKVLAEGVETEEEYDYLNENGCDALQGYLLSKPLPEEDVLKLL